MRRFIAAIQLNNSTHQTTNLVGNVRAWLSPGLDLMDPHRIDCIVLEIVYELVMDDELVVPGNNLFVIYFRFIFDCCI